VLLQKKTLNVVSNGYDKITLRESEKTWAHSSAQALLTPARLYNAQIGIVHIS
jgi:hypothetical protein